MAKKKEKEEKLEGIGGWLIVPAIGICFGVLLNAFVVYDDFYNYYFGLWHLIDIAYLCLNIWLVFSFFQKKKITRTLAIWFYGISVASFLFEILYGYYENAGILISGVVWLLYFINSERVKNTFTR